MLWNVPVFAESPCACSPLQNPFCGGEDPGGYEFRNSGCGFLWVSCGVEVFPQLMLLSGALSGGTQVVHLDSSFDYHRL